MFSRPPTPFFDLMQHRYKELWMEEQRARTRVQHVVKKKVGIVQQSFPLMCTALLSTTQTVLPHKGQMGCSQPWEGLSAGRTSP